MPLAARAQRRSDPGDEAGAARPVFVLAALLAIFVALVYVPDIGRGFLKDDFGWIARAQPALRNPAAALRGDYSGTFYRPLVLFSFAADY